MSVLMVAQAAVLTLTVKTSQEASSVSVKRDTKEMDSSVTVHMILTYNSSC